MIKRLFAIFTVVLLFLAGCNASNSNLYEFDYSSLRGQVNEVEFQSKLPSKLPFEKVNATFSSPPEQGDVQTYDFYTSGKGNNNHLELLVVKNKHGDSNSKFEEVKIGDLKGKYYANKERQTLRWKDKDIEYSLIYYAEQSDKELSKEDLIETAKSFE